MTAKERLLLVLALMALVVGLHYGVGAQTVQEIIEDRAAAHGVSPAVLVAVAHCEAPGLNPYAVGDRGESLGLFQLHARGLRPLFYQWGYDDVWDPYQQADFTARAFANGLARHWSCYRVLFR